MTEADWLRVMSGDDRGVRAATLRAALACVEPAYAGVMRLRNGLFDRGLKRSARLLHPTISVGNLTTGGTGKTPLVREIVRRLESMGRVPAVLLRGYHKGHADESDELAEYRVLGVRAIANPDRVAGATAAMQEWPTTDTFVLDDGFQHRRVKRDLDLVLIDATRPWGYSHVLPRGLLREPRGGLRRADAVVVTRADQVSETVLRALDTEIERWHGRPPIAHVRHEWSRWHGVERERLQSLPVVAVCGIGNGDAFLRQARTVLPNVVDSRTYEDHVHYSPPLMKELVDHARARGAVAIVTTMKDWVKLKPLWNDAALPIAVPEVGIVFLDGEDVFEGLLARLTATAVPKEA